MSRVTLITVNYQGAAHTLTLLRSLEKQTKQDVDVIVVDNDSGDQERAILGEYAATTSLRLDIIYSERNRGFSGGNNIGIRKALAQGSQWMLLINNDTTVEPDCIASLPLDTPGLIGLPLREGDRIVRGGEVRWLRTTLRHVHHPTYVIGAAMLIHRSVFEQVGLLDERYFLYFEDADFSMRARSARIPIRFVDGPVVTHGVSQSTQRLGAPLLLRYHARNALLFNWTNGPWWVRGLLPFVSIFGIVFQSAKVLLMPSRRAESRAIAAGIIDFYANRFGHIKNNHRD